MSKNKHSRNKYLQVENIGQTQSVYPLRVTKRRYQMLVYLGR